MGYIFWYSVWRSPYLFFPFLLWAVTWICIKGTDSKRTVTECKKYDCFSRAETMILCGFFKPLKYYQSLAFFPHYAKISCMSHEGQVGEIILHILQYLSKTQEQRVANKYVFHSMCCNISVLAWDADKSGCSKSHDVHIDVLVLLLMLISYGLGWADSRLQISWLFMLLFSAAAGVQMNRFLCSQLN